MVFDIAFVVLTFLSGVSLGHLRSSHRYCLKLERCRTDLSRAKVRIAHLEHEVSRYHALMRMYRAKFEKHASENGFRADFRTDRNGTKVKPLWRVVLGLPEGPLTRDQINKAFREKARTAHPDMGGSADAMAKVNLAREQALREAVA